MPVASTSPARLPVSYLDPSEKAIGRIETFHLSIDCDPVSVRTAITIHPAVLAIRDAARNELFG